MSFIISYFLLLDIILYNPSIAYKIYDDRRQNTWNKMICIIEAPIVCNVIYYIAKGLFSWITHLSIVYFGKQSNASIGIKRILAVVGSTKYCIFPFHGVYIRLIFYIFELLISVNVLFSLLIILVKKNGVFVF